MSAPPPHTKTSSGKTNSELNRVAPGSTSAIRGDRKISVSTGAMLFLFLDFITKGKEARAISIMFAGLTVANLLGVPVGTYIGHHFSWRMAYGIISFLGLVTLLSLYFWMPDLARSSGKNIFEQLSYY